MGRFICMVDLVVIFSNVQGCNEMIMYKDILYLSLKLSALCARGGNKKLTVFTNFNSAKLN